MSIDEYTAAIVGVLAEYTTTFGFSEKSEDAAARWIANFHRANYDAESVCAGLREGMSGKLIKRDNPGAGHHYTHLTELIRAYRGNAVERQRPEVPCDVCGMIGYAIVPHPKHVANMMWTDQAIEQCYFPTCSVFCNCSAGKFKSDTWPQTEIKGRSVKLMTMGWYEDYVAGNWKDLMEQRTHYLTERQRANYAERLKLKSSVISDTMRLGLPASVRTLSERVDAVLAPATRRQLPAQPQKALPAPKQSPPPPPAAAQGNDLY